MPPSGSHEYIFWSSQGAVAICLTSHCINGGASGLGLGGGFTVSKMCHSLSYESVHAATVLGSWCQFPDAIPWDKIEAAFKGKSKCPKGKEVASTSDMVQVASD